MAGYPTHRLHTTKIKFPEILKECKGIVSIACQKAKIARHTYYDWRKADPDFAKLCDESSETTIDFVESKLLELIDEKHPAAIIFFMKTKAKDRGYVERVETTGKDGGAIVSEMRITEADEKIMDLYIKQHKSKADGAHVN